MTGRRASLFGVVAVLILIALTVVRIAIVDNLQDQGFFAKYYEFADQILAGNPPRERIADVSPAYLWLTVLFRAAGAGFYAIRNIQIVALSLGALLCAVAAHRLGGRVAAVVAASIVLGNRAALVTATDLEPETLILLLNAAAIALVVRFTRRAPGPEAPAEGGGAGSRGVPWWIALSLGLLVGLSTIARPTALGTVILLTLWLAWQSRRSVLPFLAGVALPILAILLVNRALVGHMIIMQPGTHVYEGNNPLATAAAGVMPRIVADMNVTGDEPDYLHVAYRIVASKATGEPRRAELSNRFWSRKAFAYMRTYPADAVDTFVWKAVLAVHHYDIYDLVTTRRKADELSRWPAIPFGVAFVLAILAAAIGPRRRELLPVAIFGAATLVALVAFNVSSRQRNALLAPLAVLAGAGVAELVRLGRARSEKGLLAFGAVVIATPLLGIEGAPMREDAYNWWSTFRSDEMRAGAVAARQAGDRARAATLAATASILSPDERPLVSPPTLRATALRLAGETEEHERLFDIAIALQKAGAWQESEVVLRNITDYAPRRENRAVSSVSYYRARAALHLGAPPAAVRQFLQRAETEAPGDPDILALRSLLGDAAARSRLDAIHDPFTRDFVLAAAWRDLGDEAASTRLLTGLAARIPEWRRPAEVLDAK